MMRVRLPDGTQVVFDTAGFAMRGSNFTDLYRGAGKDLKGEHWLAQVPNEWMIEVVEPCKVIRADGKSALDSVLKMLRDRNTAGQEWLVSEIKRELQAFSTRTYRWR